MKLIRADKSCYPKVTHKVKMLCGDEARFWNYVLRNIAPGCHSYGWIYKSWADQVIETNLNYATHKN